MAPKENADTSRWRAAFGACAPTLDVLGRATDESGRLAARTWWVVCMGSKLEECRPAQQEWRQQAAEVCDTVSIHGPLG